MSKLIAVVALSWWLLLGAASGIILTPTEFNVPNGTSLPAKCNVGDEYFLTSTTTTYLCTAPNTWTPFNGGPASPSNLIGLSATPGVLNTYERSDSTHALDQSISPLWTGSHTFGVSSTVVFKNIFQVFNNATVVLTGNATSAGQPVSLAAASAGTAGLSYANHTHQLDQSISPTWSGTHTFSNSPIIPTAATADNSTKAASTAYTWQNFVQRNAQIKTVCATGCDYSTVQTCLGGLTTSASSPGVCLLMPGVYDSTGLTNGVSLTPGTDSYKSVVGWSQESVRITDSNGAHHTFFAPSTPAWTADLLQFTIANLTLEHTATSTVLDFEISVAADHRFEVYVSHVHFKGDLNPVVMVGAVAAVQTSSPSECVLWDNLIESETASVTTTGAVRLYSRNNVIRRFIPPLRGDEGYSCFATDSTSYVDSFLESVGDTCLGTYNDSINTSASAPTGCTAFNIQGGPEKVRISDFYGECRAAPGYTSATTSALIRLDSGLSGDGGADVSVSNSKFRMIASVAGQTVEGFFHYGRGSRITFSNVEFQRGWGPGTETGLASAASPAAPYSEVLLDRVVYDSNTMASSILLRNLEPTVSYLNLRGIDSVSLPSTGASFDSNNEYRVFPVSTTVNASWRNERTPDLFETNSLYPPQFRVSWQSATATTGHVTWKVGYCTVAPPAAFPCTVSTFTTVQQSATTAGQEYVTAWTALPSGLVAGQPIVWTIRRDSTDATLNGDAWVGRLEVSYGVN